MALCKATGLEISYADEWAWLLYVYKQQRWVWLTKEAGLCYEPLYVYQYTKGLFSIKLQMFL